MTRPAPIIAGTLAALLLLFGAYMGVYYAMVKRTTHLTSGWTTAFVDGQTIEFHDTSEITVATYRYDSDIAAKVFWPAHQLDRLIRPRYWVDG